MADFETNTDGGLITDTFSTREPSAPEPGSADTAPSLAPAAPANPTLDNPVTGDAEQLRQQLQADYQRKTQVLAEQRRQMDAQRAEDDARRAAFEAERTAYDPYRRFDTIVQNDPVLQQVISERVGAFTPGAVSPQADTQAAAMARMEASMQQMTVSNAEQFLMQKYPDYAANRSLVISAMDDLGVKYPGHDIVKVTKQMEAAYRLATQGRATEQVRQDTEAQTTRNLAATRAGVGSTAPGGPAPPPEVSMRRPDGKLVSYSEIGEQVRETMPRGRR